MSGLLIAIGLASLVLGAESLVRGASRLAASVGLSPLVIGLTVVAFGTSAPELAVSVKASLAGQADIALGNVVGSNIFNVLLILGVAALIAPLAVARRVVRLDVPIMIAVSMLVWGMGRNGVIGRGEGAMLLTGILVYTAFAVVKGRREAPGAVQGGPASAPDPAQSGGGRRAMRSVIWVVVGLVLLVVGARWLVEGAGDLARHLGVSELIIGLTIVAGGTSLPELATSVVAAVRGERDIAVGNVIGSNIFNMLAVLGAAAVLSPHGVAVAPAAQHIDVPVMLGAAVVCLPVFFTGGEISRCEGGLFLLYYVSYGTYLVLSAAWYGARVYVGVALLYVVVPLTLIPLLLSLGRAFRRKALPG